MRRFCLGVAGLLLSGVALADGLPAAAVGDGAAECGLAYSFGEVVSPDDRRVGPIIVVPDTLCPDLPGGPGTRIESLSIYLDGRRGGDVQRAPQAHKAPRPRYQ